jgi:pyridinium-3,5-bisthiocarboxylic acid mononucleotide nickel chelatase
MKILYLDCFSGASGDMILGALVDLGLPIADLRRALGSLTLGGYDIDVERVIRGGIGAAKLRVAEHGHEGPAHPAPHPHGHRTLGEITELIERSALSQAGRTRAVALFRRLGEVEAAIHQVPVERVQLHEVSAIDSIVDIVGAVFAFEWLAADRIVASPLNVGRGTVRTAHGILPVPAPATARLLEGVPVFSAGPEMEMVTPTGALLVTAYAQAFGPLPAMRMEKIGYGAGDRDPAGQANVLRAILGDADASGPIERVLVVQCEIDDMNPQIFGALMEQLLAAGALDVYYTPIQMKKSRPATLVTVIGRNADRERLAGILFRETTTLGLRYQEVDRERLDRELVAVDTPFGPIRMKVARRGGEVVNAAPEFDDCARVAHERQVAIKDVQAMAMKAYLER